MRESRWMRDVRVTLCAIAAAIAVATGSPAVAQSDGIRLEARRGPGPGEIAVRWFGGQPGFEVYGSESPDGIVAPANLLVATSSRYRDDTPPPGTAYFYRVTSPCVESGVSCASEKIDAAVVAQGSYPDLAADSFGNVHIVYSRDGSLRYKWYDLATATWSAEDNVGLSLGRVERSEPEIVIDSQDRPHVMVGSSYAWWDGSGWQTMNPGVTRDTAMAIDTRDNIYIVRRGGNDGGYLGLRVRYAGATSFAWLPDPDIADGLPLGRNDHVYGHVWINPVDDSVHIAYRHGAPRLCAYRGSENGGENWFGGGITGDDTEAPSGVAHHDGTIYVATGLSKVYRRASKPSTWDSLGVGINTGGRDLPALATDESGNLYITSFDGRFNVYSGGAWGEKRVLPAPSGEALGFAEVARGPADFVYVVWEEGPNVDHDLPAGTSDILFATLDVDGNVGNP